MRKAQNDMMARTVAENWVGDLFAENGHSIGDRDSDVTAARDLLGAFEAVEFEKAASKVGGKDIYLRRLVITGAWEVDPNGVK